MFHQITFPSIGSFCFDKDIKFPERFYNDQWNFDNIKKKHTETMVGLLSERYLNECPDIYYRLSDKVVVIRKLVRRVFKLRNTYSKKYPFNEQLTEFVNLMIDSIYFVNLLRNYFANQLPNTILKPDIKREEEMQKLDDLIRNLDISNENQTIAFNNVKLDEIYDTAILTVHNFTMNRYSRLIYDFRSTITMNYVIVLPFHNKNYDPTSTDCTRSRMLPNFFSSPNYHSRFDTMPN